MRQARAILVTGVMSAALAVAGLSLSFDGDARAAGHDLAAERIEAAFAVAPVPTADPAVERAAAQAGKGDLGAPADCLGQRWPDIPADCLMTGDGTAARAVRSVTVGYQTGEAATVLVRLPAPQVAAR